MPHALGGLAWVGEMGADRVQCGELLLGLGLAAAVLSARGPRFEISVAIKSENRVD